MNILTSPLKCSFTVSRSRQFATSAGALSLQQRSQWQCDGYIIVPGLFDTKEMSILKETIDQDEILHKQAFSLNDREGRSAHLAIWDYLSTDTYGNMMASDRIYRIVSGLFQNATMQHYHTKLMFKKAHTGGAFEWHQDYGYWYENGLLFPDLVTAFIAVDDCNASNGCLEIIPGSHNMGRMDHVLDAGQTCADPKRMEWVQSVSPALPVELKSGDTLFFHCNVLHRSAPNTSDQQRRALLAAYNKKSNTSFKKHHHTCTDIDVRDNGEIKKMGAVPTWDDNVFMDISNVTTVVINEAEQ